MRHFEAIVVGCGGMGSAVSYNLAKKGVKVLTLEQFQMNHTLGSSHGKTRIFRTAYYEDPRYVPLLKRARMLWEALQKDSGLEILTLTGGVMIGKEDSEIYTGVVRSAKKFRLKHKLLSSSEAMDMFPAFTLEEDSAVFHEAAAGVLFPENCIYAHVSLAKNLGCEFEFGKKVRRWKPTKEGVLVETLQGSYSAEKVVFATGGWTGRLAPGIVSLACERQVPFWFGPKGKEEHRPSAMPIFISQEGRRFYYGIPDFGDGVKAAVHHEGRRVDIDRVDRKVSKQDAAPVKEYVRSHLKGLDPEPIASTTCVYTNTVDENFVVDTIPGCPSATLVSACSGHGFKFSSVLGEAVAGLVAGSRSEVDIGFLGLGRFGNLPGQR